MHVFPYSVRPGTSAAYMGPKVDERTKRRRMDGMLALAREQALSSRLRALGTTARVLWERTDVRGGRPVYVGLTDNYLRVHTPLNRLFVNRITSARLVAQDEESLLAEVF